MGESIGEKKEEKDVDWKGQILFVNRRGDNDESNPKIL